MAIAVRLYGKHYRDKIDTKDSIIGNLYEISCYEDNIISRTKNYDGKKV